MRTGSKTCDAEAGRAGDDHDAAGPARAACTSSCTRRGSWRADFPRAFAKMVMDADQLSHLLGIVKGLQIDRRQTPLPSMRSAMSAPPGTSSGTATPSSTIDSASNRPITAETGTWDQWVEEGRRDVERASLRGCGVAHRVLRAAAARRGRRRRTRRVRRPPPAGAAGRGVLNTGAASRLWNGGWTATSPDSSLRFQTRTA